jgi:hypothetical protein
MSQRLYALMRKRGFREVLYILGGFENAETTQSQFLDCFKKEVDSYYNVFSRVRIDLTKYDLIGFRTNERDEKMIFLTEKGKNVLEKLLLLEEKMKI